MHGGCFGQQAVMAFIAACVQLLQAWQGNQPPVELLYPPAQPLPSAEAHA
jgi:hypothetical protein